MRWVLKTLGRILPLLVLALFTSRSASAQECGYSVVTTYLNDGEGRPIAGAKIEFAFNDPEPETVEHFRVITKTGWSEKRQAYVSRHGLCGQHRNVALRISAAGFAAAERVIDLPFGQQGYVVNLKREGSDGKAGFKELSCEARPSLCAGLFEENDGGTR